MHALQLPPPLFLGLFLMLLLLYWSSFRTQVPYYPSPQAVWQAVAGLLPPDRPLRGIDIGSGFGGLVLHLAALRPDSAFTGIELAPLPWLASALRARLQRSRAHFMRGDYLDLDFADFDVVFAYLSPAAMPALWEKAHSEMRRGTLLLSHEFAIPGQVPDIVLTPRGEGAVLYGWRM
jgi:SAM-dependent methyltransferase